jgi:filamentous hemagglutinin family protein
MTTRRCQGFFQVVLVGALINAAGVLLSVGYAQVTTNITSSGLGTVINGSTTLPCLGVTCNITGGTRQGSNLFHSFGSLNIGAAHTANFCNAATCGVTQPLVGIQNILGRVTGGQVSNIFGTIQTTNFGTANLFLMNPFGWIFGPNARLNVGGSFHATTADYIRLDDFTRFNAVPSGADTLLTVAAPAAFGFLRDDPGSINVQTGVRNNSSGQFTSLLQVPVGQAISFVGGPINIAPSTTEPPPANSTRLPFVLAPGGTVNLVSIASPGEVTALNRPGPLTPINTDGFARLGDVTMSGGSVVDGKEIFVRSGRLVMTDSALFPGFGFGRPGLPLVFPNGGQVNVRVSDEVRIDGFTPVGNVVLPGIRTFAGLGPTGPVAGDVPSILIDANSLAMRGRLARIQASRAGPGDPGKIEINANAVTIENGSALGSLNSFAGSGTPVTVNSRTVSLSGDPNNSTDLTGIFANSDFNPFYGASFGTPARRQFLSDHALAESGPITINASDKLTVLGSAGITSDSFAFGGSSRITLNVGDALFDARFASLGGAVTAQSLLAGTSGSITINASGQVNIQDGFRVTAQTLGSGDAGTVSITANGGLNLTGTNSRIQGITTQAPDNQYNAFALRFDPFFLATRGMRTRNYAELRTALGVTPGLGDLMQVLKALNGIKDSAGNPLVPTTDFTPGTGGTVSITTPVLTAKAGALIESSTAWDGNAGQINANVGSLFVNDGASISSTSGRVNIVTGLPTVGVGNAGEISLTASDAISISGGAVSTTTFGNGNAGNISLSANQVNVQNGGGVTSESGGTLAGQFFAGTGNAGQITVSTPTLTMANGGKISVKTSGGGNAGNISLNVANFTQSGGSRVDSSTSGAGSGGDITVTAANSASISGPGTGLFSTASGTGAGGTVTVQAENIEIVNGGLISASSTGTETATAGNVNIVFGDTLRMDGGTITTASAEAAGGNINITSTGSLLHLKNSQITTSVSGGAGGGGNITIGADLVDPATSTVANIHPFDFIVLDNGGIHADSRGGAGGRINIFADVFLSSTPIATAVTSESGVNQPGIIDIQATFTHITGEIAQLPETPLRATELLRAACAARFAGGKTSSLVLGGRDGIPLQPGGLMPSPLYLANEADAGAAGTKISGQDLPLRFSLLGSRDPRLTQYSLLPNAKCAF